jgi:hypothetical protein
MYGSTIPLTMCTSPCKWRLTFITLLLKVGRITYGLKSNCLLRVTVYLSMRDIFRQRWIIQRNLYYRVVTHFVNRFIYPRASRSDCSKQTLQNVSRKAHKILMGWSISTPGRNGNFSLRRFLMIKSAGCPALCTGNTAQSGVCAAPDIGVASDLGFVQFRTQEVPGGFLVNEEYTSAQLVPKFDVVQRSTIYWSMPSLLPNIVIAPAYLRKKTLSLYRTNENLHRTFVDKSSQQNIPSQL